MGGCERYIAAASVAGALLTGLAAASCQQQELDQSSPTVVVIGSQTIVVKGQSLSPNVMLVVDKSGSMTMSPTGTGQACTTDGTENAAYDPNSANPCKWNDLKSAIADPTTGFLATSQDVARFGLVAFPASSGACDTGTILVPIGGSVQAIQDQLLNVLTPGGETPTAATLLAAAQDPALATPEPARKHFVMLLTDGLPNCNAANAALCDQCRADAASCSATGGCQPTDTPGTCDTLPFDGAGCLDEDAMVAAVTQLYANSIGTFVIGFGADTLGTSANRVLTRAAVAGGYPLQGAAQQYYQANSLQDLETILGEIFQQFPCAFTLSEPLSASDLVEVSVTDSQQSSTKTLVQGTDWQFPNSTTFDQLELLGSWCATIQNAEANRYSIVVRYAHLL